MPALFNLPEWIPRWAKGDDFRFGEAESVDSDRSSRDEDRNHLHTAVPERARAPESSENYYGSLTGRRASSIAGERNVPPHGLLASINFNLGTPLQSSSKAGSPARSFQLYSESRSGKFDSDDDEWETGALKRPVAEPPILDYRKFEEGGRMYDSLHRHPDTIPEQWYAYTDPEIERELFDDYHDLAIHAQEEAWAAGNLERAHFYAGLRWEQDVDRGETGCDFGEVKERMYWQQRKRKAVPKRAGHRVQEQFDPVRKRWFGVDSVDSKWDEQEWEIFGNAPEESFQAERFANLTEENLRKNRGRAAGNFSLPAASPGPRRKGAMGPSDALASLLRSISADDPVKKRTSPKIPLCETWLSNGPQHGKARTNISYRHSSKVEVSRESMSAEFPLSLVLNY